MVRARCRSLLTFALTTGFAAAPLLAQGGPGGVGAGADSVTIALPAGASVPKAPPPPLQIALLAVPFPIGGAVDDQVALLVEVGGRELLA
ncbi:MAG TPA: hypothetical protein VGV61_11695, partial [Thermoanaerobaculia bacterium]|nr:hypothetical protein [Thermoanaerobaculia bacterium]